MKSNLFKTKMTLLKDTVYGPMSADLLERNLGDLCDTKNGVQTGPFGSQLHKKDYVAVGTPIITVEHLGENRIIHEDLPQVSDEDKDRLSKYVLRQGDIVFSRVGSVDRRSLVRKSEDGWLFSGRCLRVRPNPNWIDAVYLSYFLGFPTFKEHIRSIAVGATMPSINTKILKDVAVYFPPLPEQRRIAHILGTLDDKIELNRRMNETLEEMARAIFKDWFVDFGPVRAKMEGRGAYLPEEIWRLFPDRLVESELGEVPEGWGVVPLTDMMEFKEGPGIRHWQYTNSEEGTRFINIRCIQDGELILDTANRVENEEANGKYSHFHLQEWDIVLSASGTLGRSAVVRKSHLPLLLNTSVIRFRPVDGMSSFAYLRGYLWSEIFLGEQRTLASGSVQKNFGPTHLRRMKTWLPPYRLISVHESVTGPLLRRVATNLARNDGLRGLRDSLLPGLVMGEIRVRV